MREVAASVSKVPSLNLIACQPIVGYPVAHAAWAGAAENVTRGIATKSDTRRELVVITFVIRLNAVLA